MGSFFCRRNKDGEERWWLEVLGKGEKLRIVPATHELMLELARYRRELGLAPLPVQNESTPVPLPIGGKHRPMTRGAVHELVKGIFEKTAERQIQRVQSLKKKHNASCKHRCTGCGIRLDRTWPTRQSTCDMCAITWDTNP